MSQAVSDSGIVDRPTSFLKRWIARPIIAALDATWHILAFILGAVIIGGILVNVIISLLTNGTLGVADPRTWVIIRLLFAQPVYSLLTLGILLLLILLAYLGHRARKVEPPPPPGDMVERYGIAPVASVEPSNSLIPSFNPNIYIPRRTANSHLDADEIARTALRDALARRDPTSHENIYGLCVYGRKLLGTSRLAWEAMKYDVKHDIQFSKWTLVRWPTEPMRPGDLLKILSARRAQVVVWLENLTELAASDRRAQLSSLPFDLTDSEVPFVIIATCEDGVGERSARRAFGELMEHLTPIRLADITSEEANQLVFDLGRTDASRHPQEGKDGRPGAFVLALTSKRDEVANHLPELARGALQAIKLLHMVGIRDYPIKRVIATARDVFDVSGSDSEWDRALPALEEAGFVTVKTVASTLELTNDVYLDLAVPALAGDHNQIAAAWLRLKGSLEGERDWKPLARLGDMFRRQEDTHNAENCYRAALGGFTKDSDPDAWAFAQLGLGLILLVKIEESAESQRAPLLEGAKNAFQGTLAVVTPESDSAVWAEASAGLATVYRTEAALGLEALLRQGSPTTRQRRIRGQALESALTESRDALKVLRKDSTPEEWAEAEYQLGLVHYVTALLSGDLRDRRTKLDTAIEAQRRALSVYTDTDHPIKVARVERAMGDACKLRAEASIRPRKDELLNQAVSSYSRAIDISTARQLWSEAEMATIRTQLASCFRGLAILSEEPRRSEFLESAADLYRMASQAFDQQTSYVNRAEALRDLGQTLSDLAVHADTERTPSLWNESQIAFTDAFETLGGRGTRTLRAQLHLGLASIYWQRASSTTSPSPSDIVQAFGNASRAQNSFPAGEHATEINQATKIAKDAARKAQDLKIPLPGNADTSSSRNQRTAT